MEPNLQSGQMLGLTSSNASLGISDFNNFDPKTPLKSLPQELLPIPFKSMNNNMAAGGMFSTTSGNLFGSPRSVASSSSGLQSNFNYLQDSSKNGAPMSATALLQKAAQMGATASSSINSPMMQKSFATSAMAGPYVSPSLYENFQTQPDNNTNNHQLNLAAVMNDMGMYSGILMSNDHQNINTEHDQENTNTNDSSSVRNQSTVLGHNGNNDMLTVDFLGVGGSSRPPSLHEQQSLEAAINQQRMQASAINPFHQQNISHGNNSAMENPIWDI
nr:PREDICTED: zinc finger protein JACKDAW-like [Nicotiana sylvestris]